MRFLVWSGLDLRASAAQLRAAGLAELLQFLTEWPARTPRPRRLTTVPPRLRLQHLRNDLDRFTFVLGGYYGAQDARQRASARQSITPATVRSCLTNIDHGSGPRLRSSLANIRGHFLALGTAASLAQLILARTWPGPGRDPATQVSCTAILIRCETSSGTVGIELRQHRRRGSGVQQDGRLMRQV